MRNAANGPVRVALLLQDLAFGGTQRQALGLARCLDRERFSPEIWQLMAGDDYLPLLREWNVPHVRLGQDRRVGPRALVALWRRLRSDRPDVLLLLTVVPNIWGRILGRLAGVPLVIAGCRQSGNPKRQHERLLKRLAHHHICNANALKTLLVSEYGVNADKISVIYNGVDAEAFAPAARPAANPVILCVGRLVPAKDHDTLLEAFALVLAARPEAELWIVGDGPRQVELERLAGQERFRGQVRLMPARLDVLALLRQAQVMALSSVSEGFPNVVAEAMAAGLPVVATNVDGLAELVVDGETGLLVPPRDPRALADALAGLLARPAQRDAMGKAGRERVEREFSFQGMAARHGELFSRLLAQLPGRG